MISIAIPDIKTRWIVTLSDGSIHIEGFDKFSIKQGGDSPWLQLRKYIADTDLEIIGLSLETLDKEVIYNLPSKTDNPKFGMFKPLSENVKFKHYRLLGMDGGGSNSVGFFSIIQAEYPDIKQKLEVWVDEYNPTKSWSVISAIEETKDN